MIPRRVLDVCPLSHKYTGVETESNTCGGVPCTDCPDIDWENVSKFSDNFEVADFKKCLLIK